jgi:hypothetical protein
MKDKKLINSAFFFQMNFGASNANKQKKNVQNGIKKGKRNVKGTSS